MIIELLDSSIEEMNEIRQLETVSNDTKIQDRIDSNFKNAVTYFHTLLEETVMSCKKANFIITAESKKLAESITSNIETAIKNGKVNDYTNNTILNDYKKLSISLIEEWEAFYKIKATLTLNLLDTIKEITADKQKIQYIIAKIKKGASWNKDEKNLDMFILGLMEANSILKDLGMDESEIVFLQKVSGGNATFMDLSDNILEWIRSSNIGEKFAIRFMI